MATRPWTKTDAARLAELHGQGKSLHSIAKTMDRAKGTLSRKAKEAGLIWDRAQVNAATEAKVRDAAGRRANLQLLLLDDVEKLRLELFAPYLAFNFGGKDNTYNEHHLDKPPVADQLKIMQAVGAGIDRHIKLAEHDAGTGTGQIVGLLQQTAAALGIDDKADQT